VDTSGSGLQPSVLELQAITVSLSENRIPLSAPRPTRLLFLKKLELRKEKN